MLSCCEHRTLRRSSSETSSFQLSQTNILAAERADAVRASSRLRPNWVTNRGVWWAKKEIVKVRVAENYLSLIPVRHHPMKW